MKTPNRIEDTLFHQLKKVSRLSGIGFLGGKKEAVRLESRLMKQYELTLADLSGRNSMRTRWAFKVRNIRERKLLLRIVAMVTGQKGDIYFTKDSNRYYLMLTNLHGKQVTELYQLYRAEFGKTVSRALDELLEDFIAKNDIFPPAPNPEATDEGKNCCGCVAGGAE